MDRQIELPIGSAEILAADGIQRAADHANAEVFCWTDMAGGVSRLYLDGLQPGAKFTAQDIHRNNIAAKLPAPPDKRAWGAVMRALAKDGLIRSIGFVKSDSPSGHGHPVSQWVKL